MIITISGPPGSGTSTAAKLLAKELGMKMMSSGDIFRSLAKEDGLSLAEFGEKAGKDHSIDIRLDKRMLKIARSEDNLVLEGRLTGQLLTKEGIPAYRIWLTASLEERVRRITGREKKNYDLVKKEVEERQERDWKRYMDIYGIDLNSTAVYDLKIDNTNIAPKKVVKKILERL